MCLNEEDDEMMQELDRLWEAVGKANGRLDVVEERQDIQSQHVGIELGLNERLTRLEELFDRLVVRKQPESQ